MSHFFVNWLGVLLAKISPNFSVSYVFLHRRLDGGLGNTFYERDIDKINMGEFMLFVGGVFEYFLDYHLYRHFRIVSQQKIGVIIYWIISGINLVTTRNLNFLRKIYLQPVMWMTYFHALSH